MNKNITVFVVDDDEAVRDSLGLLIESAGYKVETFSSADDFLYAYSEKRNGCLVLDIRMPGMNGIQLQNTLIEQKCILPVIFITGHGDIPMAVDAIKRGATDFLTKPFNDQQLLGRINDVLTSLPKKRHDNEVKEKVKQRLTSLTERETETMMLMAEGKTNKIIAFDLDISQRTVEVHRGRVMEKMHAHSLAHLVRMLMQANCQLVD